MAGTFIISLIVFAKFDFSLTQMFHHMKTATPRGGIPEPGE